MRRPLIERDFYGTKQQFATLRNGNPADPKNPVTLFDDDAVPA